MDAIHEAGAKVLVIGDGRYRFLADMCCHHGIKDREDLLKSLIQGKRRADHQNDFPHRIIQTSFEIFFHLFLIKLLSRSCSWNEIIPG